MKIMFAAPYIYDARYKEFSKTSSGFGYMVRDIMKEVSRENEVFLLTHQISGGYYDGYTAVRHRITDILKNIRIRDLCEGLIHMLFTQAPCSTRLRYLYYFLTKGYMIYCLREISPDLIHIHGLTYQTKPFIEACEEMNTNYVVTLHGLNGLNHSVRLPDAEKKYEFKDLERLLDDNRVVTVVSTGIKRKIFKDYKIPVNNIKIVLNGTGFEPDYSEMKRIKRLFTLLCIGSLIIRKNQLQLLRAFCLLTREEQESIQIYFAGADSDHINMEEAIRAAGCAGHVRYCGFVPREKLRNFWEVADMNVVVSKEEGFGLSMIEGFTLGIPTLTFGDLDAVEDLYHPDVMELIQERTDESVADGIRRAMSRKWRPDVIRKWGKQFSMEAVASNYEKVYQETLSGKD